MMRGLYFIELHVRDWATSLVWYRDVLGLSVRLEATADRFALLDAGGGARLALKAGDPTPGGIVLSFEVEEFADWRDRLATAGVSFTEKISPEGYQRLRFSDPDGYSIVLFAWMTRD